MSSDNYYQILGVSETATPDEIKKAYRKKAVEHHPDKGGSEEEFKKISVAYDTLGDENKRKEYDNKKNNPFANMGGGFDGFDPFAEFFGNNSFYKQRKRSTPEKIVEFTIGVVDSFKGMDKPITYMRKHQCMPCNGSGGEKKTCTTCGGQGSVTMKQGTGIFVQISRHVCQSCAGKGYTLLNACFSCAGNGTLTNSETINIKLPHGIDDGQMFKIKSVGDWYENGYGDLIVKVKLIPQDNFEKNGNDLIYNLFFNYEDLMKGTVEIPHPTGPISINLPNEIDTSRPLRVKSKGFGQNGEGDLFIKQFVRFKKYS